MGEIKVIENLQLPVGIQKHITFDVTTTETCELEFFNTLTGDVPGSREKRNSIKISTIQFEMQGGDYDDILSNSTMSTFVTEMLTKTIYDETLLNNLFSNQTKKDLEIDSSAMHPEEDEEENQEKKEIEYIARRYVSLQQKSTR